MKRKLFTILFMMFSLFTLTSCVTTVDAQDGVYSTTVIDADDIEMAITYGTPYIVNDVVYYYLYNNLYYYPFYTRGYWYYRVYTRPLIRYPHYWRPVPRSHWFRDGRYYNPHKFIGHNRPHVDRPHNSPNNRPTVRPQNRWNSRPSSTRSTVGRSSINRGIPHQNSNGRFGGRR
jgi:hypothetical protein